MADQRVTIYAADLEGKRLSVSAAVGAPLMQALRDRGLVGAICGGMCSCGTCHIRVAPPWCDRCGAPDAVEADLLSALEANGQGSRLSCQIDVTADLDGLEITIMPEE